MEARKRRLASDTARAATTDGVKDLRREAHDLKEVVESHQKRTLLDKWQINQAANTHPDISPLALKVFSRLLDHHNMKTGQCNPSMGTLAEALGASERGVRGAVRQLEKHGLITTEPGGGWHQSNSYAILGLKTRKTRHTPTANPERTVSKRRNAPSAETLKETMKKKTVENKPPFPKVRDLRSATESAEKRAARDLGNIQNKLVERLGDDGWEILTKNTELSGALSVKNSCTENGDQRGRKCSSPSLHVSEPAKRALIYLRASMAKRKPNSAFAIRFILHDGT